MSLEFCSLRYRERIKNGFDSHLALKGRNVLTRLIADDDWKNAHLQINEDSAKKWSTTKCISESVWCNEAESETLPLAYCAKPSGQILPIHQACAKSTVQVNFLEKLVEAYPGSLQMCDSVAMRTPLHLAIISRASEDVIFYLLEKYRSAASFQDYRGRVPLHYACVNSVPIDVIRKLIECCPSTVLATDELEWTPLHVAAIHSQSLEKIDALLSPSPEVIMMLTRQGETATEISKHNKSDAIDAIRARLRSEEKKFKALPDFRNILEAYTRNLDKSSLTESSNFV